MTENSYTIHHFAGSRLGRQRLFNRKVTRMFGSKFGCYFAYFTMRPDKFARRFWHSLRRKWGKLTGHPYVEKKWDDIQPYEIN